MITFYLTTLVHYHTAFAPKRDRDRDRELFVDGCSSIVAGEAEQIKSSVRRTGTKGKDVKLRCSELAAEVGAATSSDDDIYNRFFRDIFASLSSETINARFKLLSSSTLSAMGKVLVSGAAEPERYATIVGGVMRNEVSRVFSNEEGGHEASITLKNNTIRLVASVMVYVARSLKTTNEAALVFCGALIETILADFKSGVYQVFKNDASNASATSIEDVKSAFDVALPIRSSSLPKAECISAVKSLGVSLDEADLDWLATTMPDGR